jgi:hypothetical protein
VSGVSRHQTLPIYRGLRERAHSRCCLFSETLDGRKGRTGPGRSACSIGLSPSTICSDNDRSGSEHVSACGAEVAGGIRSPTGNAPLFSSGLLPIARATGLLATIPQFFITCLNACAGTVTCQATRGSAVGAHATVTLRENNPAVVGLDMADVAIGERQSTGRDANSRRADEFVYQPTVHVMPPRSCLVCSDY